jgi:hypothetical protein
MFSLLVYRYFMGTKEVAQFHTSRSITLVIWIIFMSCFFFLASMKPHGTLMWATVTSFVLVAGILVAKKRAPEIKEIGKADSEMSMILYLAQSSCPEIHIFFRRPREEILCEGSPKENEVYIIFFSPSKGIPLKCAVNEFNFPLGKLGLYHHIVSLLKLIEYEMPEQKVCVHIGWPLSSWLDRLSIGVMVFNLMRLPKRFPQFNFAIAYDSSTLPQKGNKGMIEGQ